MGAVVAFASRAREASSSGQGRVKLTFLDARGQPLYTGLPGPSQPFLNGFVVRTPDGKRVGVVSVAANVGAASWIVVLFDLER
jgi:hypothetical protein